MEWPSLRRLAAAWGDNKIFRSSAQPIMLNLTQRLQGPCRSINWRTVRSKWGTAPRYHGRAKAGVIWSRTLASLSLRCSQTLNRLASLVRLVTAVSMLGAISTAILPMGQVRRWLARKMNSGTKNKRSPASADWLITRGLCSHRIKTSRMKCSRVEC